MQTPGSLDQKAINEKSIIVAATLLIGRVNMINKYINPVVPIINGQLNEKPFTI